MEGEWKRERESEKVSVSLGEARLEIPFFKKFYGTADDNGASEADLTAI